MASSHSTLADEMAQTVFKIYEKCPKKCKPSTRSDGTKEWTNLAAVALYSERCGISCVSVATGVKVLPESRLKNMPQGKLLHDCHAEILALRGFNRFLINECIKMHDCPEYVSSIIMRNDSQRQQQQRPFRLAATWKIYLIVSEIPCGDASMEQLGAGTVEAWDTSSIKRDGKPLRGRGYFSEIGVIRTKPSRPDAPISMSKSCSDKLALKQFTSALQTPTTLLIEPVYLDGVVLPMHKFTYATMSRAFGKNGRLSTYREELLGSTGTYTFQPFCYMTYSLQFRDAKESLDSDPRAKKSKPSNVSLLWVKGQDPESIVNGLKIGGRISSSASRINMTRDAVRIVVDGSNQKYSDLKASVIDRQLIKKLGQNALGAWQSNVCDDFKL
ncbi:adenosine deaminase/editase [Lipomyces arxii]|uniref:adenosine deaminase/editase n=1 Tax=Lipomyces arxii TaxID=56418 RepID=UPI0034CE517D